jgi:hypothetical protein
MIGQNPSCAAFPRREPGSMFQSKSSQFLVLAAINLVCLMGLTIVVELLFGNWFTPFVLPHAAIINRTYTRRQELYEPMGQIIYSRDQFGLRGVHEPLSQVELVTVGGSTTDQRYISEGETWQDVLRSRAGIAVANAGIDGMSSFGHIVAVSEWLYRLPNFSPRYYLHYVGVNDAALSVYEAKLSGSREDDRSGRDSPFLLSLRKRSFILSILLTKWHGGPIKSNFSHFRLSPDSGFAPMVKVANDAHKVADYIETSYKPNLRTLINLHRSRNEKVIFVSQPANPAIVRWRGPDTFVSANELRWGYWAVELRSVNAATQAVCADYANVCQFFDLGGAMIFDAADFYDLVHTTPSGSRKIGIFLADKLAFVRLTR